jgi:hypothetical protein
VELNPVVSEPVFYRKFAKNSPQRWGLFFCQCGFDPSLSLMEEALQQAQAGLWLPQELQSRTATLQQASARLDKQLDRLTEAYLAAIIPLAEYQRRRNSLT